LTPSSDASRKLNAQSRFWVAVPKNNPVLIGEPGVGKTAIAEGLAQRIVNKKRPRPSGRQAGDQPGYGLVAGTRFRGEFEERLKAIMDEIRSAGNIILIDEVHTLIGTGGRRWMPPTYSSLPWREVNYSAWEPPRWMNTVSASSEMQPRAPLPNNGGRTDGRGND